LNIYKTLGKNLGQASVLNTLGSAYLYKGDNIRAIDHFMEALKL